tara:strand:+ start:3394 stop:4380 length:987 start_codon:yes stop_codon:yes gene_type:complete
MDFGVLLSKKFVERFDSELSVVESGPGVQTTRIIIDVDNDQIIPEDILSNVQVAFFSNDIRYRRDIFLETLARAKNLKWLHFFAVGINPKNFPQLINRDISITNSPGANAEPIALNVLAAILWLGRPFKYWRESQIERVWAPIHYDDAPPDIGGQTLLIIGLGEIGRRVARYAKSIGMHVIGIRRNVSDIPEGVDEIYDNSELDNLLHRAEWLVLSCPLNDETEGLISAERLSKLPKGSRIINVSRGPVINEESLTQKLISGHLGGAYLDVFKEEPLPPVSPLWTLPNVIVTPHNSAISDKYHERSAQRFFENLMRWRKGEPLHWVIQ